MLANPIKIAHISDLHLSKQGDPQSFQALKTDLAGEKPDIIIATGDVVDNPWEQGLESACERLEELCG